MTLTPPTLARDHYCIEVDGWGDFGRVPCAIEGERLVCAACVVRRRVRVYVVCAHDYYFGSEKVNLLKKWGYRKAELERLPQPEPDWWAVGYGPD